GALTPPHRSRPRGEFAADLAPRLAAKSAHACGHVGLEADALLFAVVADVDACRDLGVDGRAYGPIHLDGKHAGIERLARLAANEQVGQDPIARQAADVGRQDSLLAADHPCLLSASCCPPDAPYWP